MTEKNKKVEEDIPVHFIDRFGTIARESWKHDDFRYHILKIVEEREDSVQFMDKVRLYAGREIDARLFTSVKYYLTAIITALITSVIGVLIGRFWK